MNSAQRGSIAVLLLRLVAGVALMFHGWGKIQDPLHWMDQAPNPPPGFLQALAAVSEFGGGLGLALGLLTPLCLAGIFSTMSFALYTHISRGDHFVAQRPGEGSYELALIYWVIALALFFTGPGRYSLDQKLLVRRRPNDYD